MANKITCTCGHSWNKSDSSKKDAYVCHVCGKNIKNMQLGGNIYPASYVPQAEEGWLERYADGGSMQEHQENYNDSSVSMGPGFVGMGNNTKGRNYSPAWGGQFEDGGDVPKAQDGTLEKIYSKWPALKKLGNVTIKPDESFTKEKTKAGDIEFFSPDTPQVTYSSGYVAPHPGPGTYGILYNPINNNEQNIRLDMLHGMPEADSHFRRLRNSFERSVKHSDIHKSMNYWYGKDKESGNAEDGRKRWMDNYVDGQIRTLLYEGDRSKQNYSDEEANELLAHPKIKKKFDKLNSYLQKGQFGTSLPGATGRMYMRTGAPSKGPHRNQTDVTDASAQNGAEMSFYQNGLDWTPKNISRDGSVIKDDRGQWAHPGEITEIGSNQITMKGVPYPVLGVSDEGDTQMMYPGEDYKFKGKKVTEYPVAQNGKTLPTVNIKKEPIYVDDPNDPRLRAYQDSLQLTKAPMEAYKKSQLIHKMVEQGEYDEARKLIAKGVMGKDTHKILDRLKKYNKKEVKPIKGSELGWGFSPIDDIGPVYKKPVQPVQYKKAEPKKEMKKQEAVKKEQPKPVERKQNSYEGSPVYSSIVGSGLPSALIGFANQQGDTTFIKPEDYERFGVPKYGKEYIESKTANKKKNGGWLEKYK